MEAQAKRPFRLLLAGDGALVAELRAILLSGHGDRIPLDANACLESIDLAAPGRVLDTAAARCVIFVSLPGEATPCVLSRLEALELPVFAVAVDPNAPARTADEAPSPAGTAHYTVPALGTEHLSTTVFPQLLTVLKGVEVAVGRRLPVLREVIATHLTAEASMSSLRIAVASALVDHVPVLGVVLGTVASAGDTLAITGIQAFLLLQIAALYGHDPDLTRLGELVPVVGGGFGWRALARELSGFIPVAGILIKGGIAYAGTLVVGQGAAYYYQQGRPMSARQMRHLYEEARARAVEMGRDLVGRLNPKKRGGSGGGRA
ncbi:hypothetical protein EPN44_02340 [bacterium]|nr:MAG: hypothetical protein EPN44_02340 [bacterium]